MTSYTTHDISVSFRLLLVYNSELTLHLCRNRAERKHIVYPVDHMLNVCLLCRFTSCLSFYSVLNELNDYAGQREVVAEEMAHKVYGELMRYSQDLKAERKHVSTLTSLYFTLLCLSLNKSDT